MKHRLPEINDWTTLGRAERMLKAHLKYRKVGESGRPVAAKIRTTVEVTVIHLTQCLPRTSPKRRVPNESSQTYRGVVRATTRRGSGGKVNWKQKKRLRNEAYVALVSALDFLDT